MKCTVILQYSLMTNSSNIFEIQNAVCLLKYICTLFQYFISFGKYFSNSETVNHHKLFII